MKLHVMGQIMPGTFFDLMVWLLVTIFTSNEATGG